MLFRYQTGTFLLSLALGNNIDDEMIEEVGTAFAVFGFLAVFGVLFIGLLVLMIAKKGICAALKVRKHWSPRLSLTTPTHPHLCAV